MMKAFTMFTHAELEDLRERARSEPELLAGSPDLLDLLIRQAEYALDCARLLDEAIHYPAEPYGEAEVLVARLTDGCNDIWNRHRYGEAPANRISEPSPARIPER